jgi:SAM-dependent methyltransferase
MSDERERWNERYRNGDHGDGEEPSPLLAEFVESLPDGRALDVATGTGRNARFLAEQGYRVDAVDISEEALAIARERTADTDLAGTVDWIRADLDDYALPEDSYDVVVVDFYHTLGRLPAIKEALAPGGCLVYEHFLRSATPTDRGPSGDRFRFRSNDLLRACLDLTILHYEETTRTDADGGRAAIVTLVARDSAGGAQRYPSHA